MVGESPLESHSGSSPRTKLITSGDFYEVRSKLELVFASASPSSRDRLRQALDELAGIVKLLGSISIGRKILFRPTLAHNAEVSLLMSPRY